MTFLYTYTAFVCGGLCALVHSQPPQHKQQQPQGPQEVQCFPVNTLSVVWMIKVFEWTADSPSLLQNRHGRCRRTAEVSSRPSRENNASRFSLRRRHKTVAIQPWHGMKSNCWRSFCSFLFLRVFGLSDRLSNRYLYNWMDCKEFKARRRKFVFPKWCLTKTTGALQEIWNERLCCFLSETLIDAQRGNGLPSLIVE